jgi:hypothetical protein
MPEESSDKAVTWTSSNTSVATVTGRSITNGIVIAKAMGKTIITVATKDGSKTATCEITVQSTVKNTTQVRFRKEKAYTNVTEMTVGDDKQVELASYYFGTAAGTSPYYDISAGNHIPFYYDSSNANWFYCLNYPYTYNFQKGRKYTIVCSDSGGYFRFSVTDDGTF